MKTLNKQLALFFSILMIFQSCAVYTGNHTLEEAAEKQSPAKVTMVDGKASKFDLIKKEGNDYVGITTKRFQEQTTALDENVIDQIKLKSADRENTRDYGTAFLIFGGIIAVLVGLTVADFDLGFD
ncbi:MAG: hypothetical protein KJO49_09320 [Bacteroidia bacterium]|nr:hypothetical protein [Bacteroidia bacterium]NNF82729.1 hypothetical protein [Flavobacteriaceae bacterium]NNK69163.1 hypothetical protein [Flavobacteriaceae bacterium]